MPCLRKIVAIESAKGFPSSRKDLQKKSSKNGAAGFLILGVFNAMEVNVSYACIHVF